jgi:pyridoxine/pyridoxamine 5'-phosphate oxidase
MIDAMADDPIALFSELFAGASQAHAEANAMVLSTVDADGQPSGRYVLLKAVDERGFVFYTNLGSRKARALAANALAALTFYWPPDQQVRVEGRVERVADAEADAYFTTRPREWLRLVSASKESPSRGRPSGAAIASSHGRSNSGDAIRIACTSASSSSDATAPGRDRSCFPDRSALQP